MSDARYRPLTDKERALIMALSRCRLGVNSMFDRFIVDMAIASGATAKITEKQAAFLADIAWRSRRQLPPDIRPTVRPVPSGTRRPNELAGAL